MNPLDLKTVFLAKHAQHVVLIHFPIALFISAVAFDFMANWTMRRALADTAYYNLLAAAIFNSAGSRNWNTRLAVPTRGPDRDGQWPPDAALLISPSAIDDDKASLFLSRS